MEFKDLNLSIKQQTKTVTLNNQVIHIKQYLPIQDKMDLIQVALQKAKEENIYNEIKLDLFFNLNIIYLYTDIEFSTEDREDEIELYDKLESNDVIDKVISQIPEEEFQTLVQYLTDMSDTQLQYKHSAAGVIQSFIQDLPKNAAAAKQIVDSFDPNKYQEVIDFATAANGGRSIKNNAAPVNEQPVPVSTPAQEEERKVLKIQKATKKA